MKKGKRVKPIFPIEYRLLMTQRHKERDNEAVTLIALRTVNEFRNFLYEITVDSKLEDRTLHLYIHGLRAPQVSIPGTGPAKFTTEIPGLKGHYTVVISKPTKEENVFEVTITDKLVMVEASPHKRFADLVTTEEDW